MGSIHQEIQTITRSYKIRTMIIASIIAGITMGPVCAYMGNAMDLPGLLKAFFCAWLAGIVVGFVSTTMNARKFIAPTGVLVENAELIAQGDLRPDIDDTQSMGQLGLMRDQFNFMASELRAVGTEIRNAGGQLGQSTEEAVKLADNTFRSISAMASAIGQIATGATNQAIEMQETSKSVGEMTQLVEEIADSSSLVAANSKETEDIVEGGLRSSNFQREKVAELMGSIKKVASSTGELQEKSTQIGQIVDVITDIASQTNLLALNAAIEAARAGEQGRGFAVVAEEVRKLAEDTSSAANRIYGLIEEIQVGTEHVVNNMVEAGKVFETQTEGVYNNEKLLLNMKERFIPVNEEAKQIAAASNEIMVGVESISREVENIATVSQETAAATQEVLASTEEQERYIEKIRAAVNEFAEVSVKLKKQAEVIKLP
ncbi:MAG: methyl-accepting chemotaxis protein [Chitinophagales bacterium]